jgi:uncharacterized membrane protein YeaQ/YmgE (transglycosylase-associated protein family)
MIIASIIGLVIGWIAASYMSTRPQHDTESDGRTE